MRRVTARLEGRCVAACYAVPILSHSDATRDAPSVQPARDLRNPVEMNKLLGDRIDR